MTAEGFVFFGKKPQSINKGFVAQYVGLLHQSWTMGSGETKVRLVARGFEETKNNFRTDSPTCLKESLRVALTIAASECWIVNSIDIKAAFLQEKPFNRKVFLKAPKKAGANGKTVARKQFMNLPIDHRYGSYE